MKKIGVLLIVITLLSFSCSSKEKVKPSADSILTQNTLRVVDRIKDAYQKKDMAALRENLSSELSESFVKEFIFETSELSLMPRMVKIKPSTIRINVNWHGRWVVKDKTLKNRGAGVFIFRKETLKLIQIKGDNPFQTPLVK